MKQWIMTILMTIALAPGALAADGVVAIESEFPVKETIDRLEKAAIDKAMTVFLRIDHAAGARKIGQELRPTELLVFGNPKGGTPLLQCAQSVGIDLPLKALAWQDASGRVWLGYNDPTYVARRHQLDDSCATAVDAVTKALGALAQAAAHP